MGDWVDDPDLGDAIGTALLTALITHVPVTDDIRQVVDMTGLTAGDHPFGAGATATMAWPSILREAVGTRRLGALIQNVIAAVPGSQPDLAVVLLAQRSAGSAAWYHSAALEQARLMGPRLRWAMIDRDQLRTSIVHLIGVEGSPILSIKGDPGLGKTHSRQLLQHVVGGTSPPWQLVVVDVAELWPADEVEELTARDFVAGLSMKLGVDSDYGSVPEHTEAKRIARELVMVLSGRYKGLPRTRRVLFVDGLDRPNVGQDVGVAIAHIAKEIATSEFNDTRLVVTGYAGNFATDVERVLERDRVAPLTDSHLRLFFESIGTQIGKPVSPADLNTLVERTLEDASYDDLATLGSSARDVAHDHFGGA